MYPSTRTMDEKLQSLKDKPQHVRERIAILVSGGITLLVFLGWIGTTLNSHTFALSSPSTESEKLANPLTKVAETRENFSTLLGATGASGKTESSAPTITIVNSPAPVTPTPEATVIHF